MTNSTLLKLKKFTTIDKTTKIKREIKDNVKTLYLLQNLENNIKKIIKKNIKLYKNYIGQDTMVKLTKLYLKWKSYYNRIKTAILGEK